MQVLISNPLLVKKDSVMYSQDLSKMQVHISLLKGVGMLNCSPENLSILVSAVVVAMPLSTCASCNLWQIMLDKITDKTL